MRLGSFIPAAGVVVFTALTLGLASCAGGPAEPAKGSDVESFDEIKSEAVADPCDCLKGGLGEGQKKYCRESKRDTQFLELLRQCGISEVGGVSAVNNMPDDGQFTMSKDQSALEWQGNKVGLVEKGTVPIRSCVLKVEDGVLVSGSLVVEMGGIVSTSQEGLARRELGKHLRSADFFDVGRFPEARFSMTSSKVDGRGNLKIKGKLSIKGVVKETEALMSFLSIDPVVASATMTFDRADFGVQFGSGSFFDNLGDDLISDQVQIRMALVEDVVKRKLPG